MSKKIIGITVGTNFDKQKLKELVPDTVPIDKVDASKVVFSEDVYTGYAVGNIKLANGKGLMAQKGQTLLDVLKTVYSTIIYPSKTEPNVTVKLTNAGAKEVGTVFTPSYTATFNKGSYTLSGARIDSGVTLGGWKITDTDNQTSEPKQSAADRVFPGLLQ